MTLPSVSLRRLALENYRNYRSLQLPLDGRHVCLFGHNGAGKTNLIEAISQLSPGRGLRSATLTDVTLKADQTSASRWALSATLHDGGVDQVIGVDSEIGPDGRGKRAMKLDGVVVSPSDVGERLRMVWLTPAMDRVFAGGASERRKFLDRQTLAHFPSHGRLSAAYEKAMRERNSLLERGVSDPVWIEAVEARMVESGAQIIVFRQTVLSRMQSAIEQRSEDAFPKADLALSGAIEDTIGPSASIPELEDLLRDGLADGRRRDAAAGRTLFGPHRSDMVVVHRPTGQVAAQCSTGQQKALLISLILANASALQLEAGLPQPLILLDEAAAHLDPDRRAALYDALCALDGQAWLTGTEAGLFEAFGDRTQRIEVADGAAKCVD